MSLEGISAEERELSLSSRNNKGKLHRKRGGGVPYISFRLSPLHSRMILGRTSKVHNPRSQSPLHIGI